MYFCKYNIKISILQVDMYIISFVSFIFYIFYFTVLEIHVRINYIITIEVVSQHVISPIVSKARVPETNPKYDSIYRSCSNIRNLSRGINFQILFH